MITENPLSDNNLAAISPVAPAPTIITSRICSN
jgi:hypothetical protein